MRCLNLQGKGDVLQGTANGMVIAGQVIASLGSAFFINPPPLVASTWFADDERTMATTVAFNADALGIAVAYFVCPLIATNRYVIFFRHGCGFDAQSKQ